ncbi:hypothetical protein MKW94_025703 [Papaver nudicaule]|uniref:RRM domain-containing protein n=1 Tax=Papaver nudicaule TaxID=74823 RepID=A0AA41VLK2_PAPNU|nr:hypothetical protein [Papaver nudicaule]
MDLGRYMLQQDRVYTSALKGYHAGHEADFRVGGIDSGRRFDGELSRGSAYPWNTSHRQMHDRDTHANSYSGTDSFHNHGFDRPARFSGRSHADISPYDDDYDYDYKHHISRRKDDRYERDTVYGLSNYGSDCDKSSKRYGSCKRFDSRVRDKQILSWERYPSPEHSLSRGHAHRQRSRSPQVHSRWKENYDDRRKNEHSSMVPSATIKVMGLSSNTTKEDLYQILAEWRPICNFRVVKEKNSGSSCGFALIDFPSVEAARSMMEEVGYDGLVDNGRELSFEYGVKKIKSKKQVMRKKLSSKRRRREAAVAASAQTQQQEEEKEVVEEEEGEVEDKGAGERQAEVEKLLQGEVEELLQQQQQEVGEGEFEIGEILDGPSSHGISAIISCEELEEKMNCIKKDPYLKAIVEDIEIGGPEVMMRYLSDPGVLQKLGHALGFGVSESIST